MCVYIATTLVYLPVDWFDNVGPAASPTALGSIPLYGPKTGLYDTLDPVTIG